MKHNYIRALLLLILLILPGILFAVAAGAVEDQITIFVPAFQGPKALGQSVATIVNLQIWQTLRKAPTPNPYNLSFGSGLVSWSSQMLDEPSHEHAEKVARRINVLAQFVLWGKVYSYGDGAIAQAYLTIPKYYDFREQRHELWTILIPLSEGSITIQSDIPKRRYAFEPIILTKEIIKAYSLPNSLPLYKARNSSQVIGSVGDEYLALEHDAGMVEVKSGEVTGWVHLPLLSKNRSEVVDFVGGLIRIFRSDWQGASSLFQKVIRHRNTPNELKVDAYLLLGLANAKRGKSSLEQMRAAYELNRYARRSVQYWGMSCFDEFNRAGRTTSDGERQRLLLKELKNLIQNHRYLFLSTDPWLNKALEAIDRLENVMRN